ncbi:small multi-drug export protein [Geomicrobium sp. JSM 1781026]|uniref:small multi-drug export protein n=1 Tax=Geomicrobium sp. JSM 1781026 TaxID=3344580 RepID=UPI0035C20AC1
MINDFLVYLLEVNPLVQHLGILVLAMIPFLETFFGSFVGAFIGVPIVTAAISSMIGNWLSVMAIILPFNALFRMLRERREAKGKEGFFGKRAKKAQGYYDKYGVPGLALIAPLIASGHIAAFISLAAGASRGKVILWHTVSIVVWGVLGVAAGYFGYLAILQ